MELLTLIAILVAVWLVFTILVKIVKATVRTAFYVAVFLLTIALILQFAFELDLQDIWQFLQQLWG